MKQGDNYSMAQAPGRFIVYGAGAIGSVLGGLLAAAGEEAVLVGREAHAAAVKRDGLLLVRRDGSGQRVRIDAVARAAELTPQSGDCLVLTAKSQATAPAVEQLRAVFPADTPVVLLQNGVRNEEIAAQAFRPVYGALVLYSGSFMRPGVVEYTAGDKIAIGRYPEGVDEFVTAVAQAWRRAGFQVTEHEQVMTTKWAKLIVNLNNATYAIIDTWVQRSLADREVREFMADVCDEGLRVLDAAGISVADKHNLIPIREEVRRMREGELRSLAEAEAIPLELRHYPSTWQDLALGRADTEVDLFNGEIVRLGRAHGVATPYNETLLVVTEQMTQARERPGRHTLAELKALCRRAAAGGPSR